MKPRNSGDTVGKKKKKQNSGFRDKGVLANQTSIASHSTVTNISNATYKILEVNLDAGSLRLFLLIPFPPFLLDIHRELSAMSANATSDSSLPAGSPTFAMLFAPVFWGFCAALMLCGISAMQGYMYFNRYNDKLGVRIVAATMLILEFVSIALVAQSVYYYTVPSFGNLVPIHHITKELVMECLIGGVITFIGQMFFVYQLWMVKSSGSGIFPTVMRLVVVAFSIVGLVTSVGCSTMMFIYPQEILANRNHKFAIFAGISKTFGAAADVVATIAMCMFLSSADTGITGTSSMLKSLMHLIINRGILVTAAQVSLTTTFFAAPKHLYWLAIHINTTRLYVNTFFGMLNARTEIRDRFTKSENMTFPGDTTFRSHRLTAAKATFAAGGGEKMGDLDGQEYSMGQIRVTTSSTVAEI
ncbi:hypothetical protein C8F04DRAFT_1260797 [Mycena alexandri]|uniref:DUF6534 domain-containing protein n=1 Tax=Mycena alexandri TaxID=1745969 RepID=A0AAD6SUA6_9AGAR|nr:hypothetical protein C8F04DRAFT_1260797 [Mycena alexandri]